MDLGDRFPLTGHELARGRLEITDGPTGKRFVLDGVDVTGAVRNAIISVGPGAVTTATLELVLYDGAAVNSECVVYMPADTRDLLVRYGWSPPPGQ